MMQSKQIFRLITPNKPFLSLLSVEVLIGALGELMPDSLKKGLEDFVQSILGNQIQGVWGKVWIVLFLSTVLFFLWLSYRKEKNALTELEKPVDIFEAKRIRIIEILKSRYRGRIDQKLDERIILNLTLKYTTIGSSEDFTKQYFTQDTKIEKSIRTSLSSTLEKYSHLLIIGEPGAGKTTLLLNLAIDFLEKAANDESLPIPVIFNLASWDKENFGEWLLKQLQSSDMFDADLALNAIQNRRILLFLDGLDEISNQELRSDCLQKIKAFLLKYEPKGLVICSRVSEYKEISANAPVNASLIIEPLKPTQVRKVLSTIINGNQMSLSRPFANKTAAQNMLLLMNKSVDFAKTICIPLYFNLASQVFDDQDLTNALLQTKNSVPDYLVEKFVEKKLSINSKLFPYENKNKYWLSWLAKVLNQDNVVTFQLLDLQPKSLKAPGMYGLCIGITNGLFFGLAFGLLGGVFVGSIAAILIGLLFGSIYNWVTTLNFNNLPQLFQTLEKETGFWKGVFIFVVVIGLTLAYLVSFAAGLLTGVITALVVGLIYGFFQGLLYGVAWGLIIGLLVSLVFDLVCLPFFSPILQVMRSIPSSPTPSPYQGFKAQVNFNLIRWGLAFCLAMSFIQLFYGAEFLEVLYFALIGFALGIIGGFLHTLMFFHMVLRVLFFLEGSMPIQYVNFLNYATEIRILENDGGQWRFRHKVLQDYFKDAYDRTVS